MIPWFVLTVATSVATVLVATPIIIRLERSRAANALAAASDRDQLQEREGKTGDGASQSGEPARPVTGRADVQRPPRMAHRADGLGGPYVLPSRRTVAVASTIVLGLLGVYAFMSGPGQTTVASGNSAAGAPTSTSAAPQNARRSEADRKSSAGLPSVEELAQRLVTRLQQNPRDPEGWRLLGLSYANIGRPSDAATAFARAIELNPTNAEIRAARVEALVKAAGGQVTSEAATALEEGLKLAPANPELRYFKGLSEEQAGDKKAAYAMWSQILKEDDPKEPWADDLRQHIADVGRDLGIASSTASSSPASQAEPGSPAAMVDFLQSRERPVPSGGSTSGIGAASSTSVAGAPADSSAMIRGMVESLARRLEQSPNDLDGWLKLMRSRVVLGQQELAKQAFDGALRASGDDAQAREKVMTAAGQLGIR